MQLINLSKQYTRWEDRRNKQILSTIENNVQKSSSLKILDLGCGDGSFTSKIKKLNQEKIEIYGVDIQIKAGIKDKEIKSIRADLDYPLPFKRNIFDIITANQVIEHLNYPINFLKEMKRIIKPNGTIVLSTENLSSWDNIIALILGHLPFSMGFQEIRYGNPFSPNNQIKESFLSFPAHKRIFTIKSLQEIIEFLNMDVKEVKMSGYLLPNILLNIDPLHSRFITFEVQP